MLNSPDPFKPYIDLGFIQFGDLTDPVFKDLPKLYLDVLKLEKYVEGLSKMCSSIVPMTPVRRKSTK